MSENEYDMKQFKELAMGTIMPMVVSCAGLFIICVFRPSPHRGRDSLFRQLIAFMHFKYEAILPLVTTSIMTATRLYDNKLMRIYLFGATGAEFERPFKVEEGALAKMLKDAAQPPADDAATGAAAGDKKKSKKNKKTD